MFVDYADAIYVKLHDTVMRNDVKKCKHLIETMAIDLNKQFRLHKKVRILNFLVFVYQSTFLHPVGRALTSDWFPNNCCLLECFFLKLLQNFLPEA